MPLDTRPTLPRTFFGSSAPSNGTDHLTGLVGTLHVFFVPVL